MTARVWHQVAFIMTWLSLLVARPMAAQRPTRDATSITATREALESSLEMFENAARSQGYSRELREEARQKATALRRRLERGDFGPGEPILLSVEGQAALTDTFVVSSDRSIVLPTIGKVSLSGVLRSELEPLLTEQIARYIRDPVVTASSFVRVSVRGAVGRPGFHAMSPDTPLSAALMVLGLTATSGIEEIEVLRQGQPALGGEELQLAIRDGTTLSELGMRSGDQIVVPQRTEQQLSPFQLVRNLGLISGIVFTLGRIF